VISDFLLPLRLRDLQQGAEKNMVLKMRMFVWNRYAPVSWQSCLSLGGREVQGPKDTQREGAD
ncbi:MAG: hypothetical protein WBO24_14440, partial [Nitrospirales bacterium]